MNWVNKNFDFNFQGLINAIDEPHDSKSKSNANKQGFWGETRSNESSQ